MNDEYLSVKEVTGGYGDYIVIDGVSLRIKKGQVVALLGPNGHGKTTLAKMISCLVPISGGAITFRGERIDGHHPDQVVRLGISHIPQGDQVFTQMSVEENLLAGAYLRWEGSQIRVAEILSTFPQLEQRKQVAARVLSGGERRMLALARGLMSSPSLLIVDEPSLGLAPRMRETLYDLLKKISVTGTSMLLIEEKTSHLQGLADYVYVMESGKIVLNGETADVLNNTDELMKALIGV